VGADLVIAHYIPRLSRASLALARLSCLHWYRRKDRE